MLPVCLCALMQSRFGNIIHLGASVPTASETFSVTMTYVVREADDEFGYDDSYALEPLSVNIGTSCLSYTSFRVFLLLYFIYNQGDYVVPKALRPGQFKSQWAALGDCGETVAKLSLNYTALDNAVPALIDLLNLAPCDGTEQVHEQKTAQDLLLAGTFTGGSSVLCRCMLVLSVEHGCLLKVCF